MEEYIEERTSIDQRLTRLEHGARQPRLDMEADGQAGTKTRERTEGAATTVQAMHGDSCITAQQVKDGPKISISFGTMAEPPNLPCREDVLAKDGATSPESCLPSLEMRSSRAAGGLLIVPTGEASTATETNFNQTPLSSVLHDRGDGSRGEFEGDKKVESSIDSIRLVRQQCLPGE